MITRDITKLPHLEEVSFLSRVVSVSKDMYVYLLSKEAHMEPEGRDLRFGSVSW